MQQGFLAKKGEYQQLCLTEEGRHLLHGHRTPKLLKPAGKAAISTPTSLLDSWEGVDRGLFEHLRILRRQCADRAGLPAYIIFSDATLRDMARRRPSATTEFLSVHGVGTKKAENFGALFVEQIIDYCAKHHIDTNVRIESSDRRATSSMLHESLITRHAASSFPLFDSGKTVEEVAEALGRAPSTARGYLNEYLRVRKITDATRWVSPREVERIELIADYAGSQRLKPIFGALHGMVDYESIRIVLTCRANRNTPFFP